MNPELPKTVRDALASGAASAHPSVDMLAAFVEDALRGAELQKVTDHLSRCVECREVVFLTSSLGEGKGAIIPAIAASASREQYTPATQAPAALTPVPAQPTAQPRRRWEFRIGWVVPITAVAVVVVAGVLLYRRWEASRPAPEFAAAVSSSAIEATPPREQTATTALQSEAQVPATKPAQKPATGAAQRTIVAKSASKMAEVGSSPIRVQESASALSTEDKLQAAANEPTAPAVAGQVQSEQPKTSAAPPAPAPAPGPSITLQDARGLSGAFSSHAKSPSARLSMSPSVAQRAVTPSTWRISSDGQLEHFTQGAWTRALADEPTVFRAVAVVGNSVWAGGSSSTLLHSSDAGQHWDHVALPPTGHQESDSIVSIRFEDSQHGIIATQSGQVFATSDGGANWAKQ